MAEYLVSHGVAAEFWPDVAEGMKMIMQHQDANALEAAWVMRAIYQRVQEWVKDHKVLKHVHDQKDAIAAFVKIWCFPGQGHAYNKGWGGYQRLTYKIVQGNKLRVHYQLIDGEVRLVWAGLKESTSPTKKERERRKLDRHEPFLTIPEMGHRVQVH